MARTFGAARRNAGPVRGGCCRFRSSTQCLKMAQAFVLATVKETPAEGSSALWVVLTDSPTLAIEAAGQVVARVVLSSAGCPRRPWTTSHPVCQLAALRRVLGRAAGLRTPSPARRRTDSAGGRLCVPSRLARSASKRFTVVFGLACSTGVIFSPAALRLIRSRNASD